MIERRHPRRLLGHGTDGAGPSPSGGLRVGDVLSGGGLPAGAAYVMTEALPTRWGRLRFRGRDEGSGAAVEVWCAPEAGVPLPGPLEQLRALRHRHLQALLAVGQNPSGHAVAVLAAPPGQPLRLTGRALPPQEALAVLGPLGRALDGLHAAGLCHLELRPEHIFIPREEEQLVLGGLGQIALEMAAGEPSTGSRIIDGSTGSALLTICAYLAPEQILPERATLIHRRTDVYALSALAFHMLSGVPPFGPDGEIATLGAHLAAWRPLCSAYRADLGEAVDAVLQRGLALDPQGRPPSCGELVDDLRAALASTPPPVVSDPQPQPCVLVVAGSAPARRELQSLVAAVSPRNPVLADGGAHAMTLALRYRPQLVLLHQPSLSEPLVVALCQQLCAEPQLQQTQVVVLLQQPAGPGAQELAQLGVTIAAGPTPSSSSSQTITPPGARPEANWPLLQLLRRLLHPLPSRSRRPLG